MRTLVDIAIPVEAGNAAFKDGRLQRTIAAAVKRLRPEASYFYPRDGKRHGLMVFDLKDSSQLPSVLEPFFQELGASVDVTPVMNLEDLQKGMGPTGGK